MENSDDSVFQQIVKDALPGRMITNFVLIAEIIDNDSEQLSLFMSDGMTPWLARGMMLSAETMVSDAESFGDDDES